MTGRPVTNNRCTETNKRLYKDRSDEYKLRVKERQKQIRLKIAEIKLSAGCSKCGYNKSAKALQFHHTNDDKEHNVSRMAAQGRALRSILVEIEKCVIVCANCHAEIHDIEL
jgi:hypothetical protein